MSVITRLCRGEILKLNGKLLAMCPECRKVIRIDKPFLGAFHICAGVGTEVGVHPTKESHNDHDSK